MTSARLRTAARVANQSCPRSAEYILEQQPAANDLALLEDDDLPLPLPRQLNPAMQRTARLASLDQHDGIEL